jgi:hypothetical protein
MKFESCKIQFSKIFPEFINSLSENYDENYFNSFIGDFGLFILKLIKENENLAKKYLIRFNDLYNINQEDSDFINLLNVNALEILTDEYLSQKLCLELFNDKCYKKFREYLDFFYIDLTKYQ